MKVKAVVTVMLMSAIGHSSFALNQNEISAFSQGKASIQKNNVAGYEKAMAQLKGTTVAPYLQYYYVQKNFKKMAKEDVVSFINNNQNALFASSLQNDFYRYQFNQKEYGFVIAQLKSDNSSFLRCLADDATLKTNPKAFDVKRFQNYWDNNVNIASTCQAVEAAWLKEHATVDEIDQKVNKLLTNLQFRRAKTLLNYLPDNKRTYYQSMVQVMENPAGQLMKQGKYYKDSSFFYATAVRQWGRKDSTSALQGLDFIQKNKLVTNADYVSVRNLLMIFQAGRADAVNPLVRIESIPKGEQGNDLKISGFKLNAQAGKCSEALDYLNRLSDNVGQEPTWVYWQGRMNQCLGNQTKAKEHFESIATLTSFYGFLAADELNKPYSVLASIVKRTTDQPAPLTDGSFKLALDLIQVNEDGFAAQAWQRGISKASLEQKNSASFKAYDLGYYDYALRAAVAAKKPGALHIRYPMGYQTEVNVAAKLYNYPPEILWGLIRQESLFQPKVKSHADAHGLMQLLIPTAEKMARKLGEKRGSLYDPTYNIRYGSAYLDDVSDIVGNVWPYMLASYNAGPHKVVKWIDPPMEDMVLWIESIPYKETRGYVKSILENVVIYHAEQGKNVRITEYLQK